MACDGFIFVFVYVLECHLSWGWRWGDQWVQVCHLLPSKAATLVWNGEGVSLSLLPCPHKFSFIILQSQIWVFSPTLTVEKTLWYNSLIHYSSRHRFPSSGICSMNTGVGWIIINEALMHRKTVMNIKPDRLNGQCACSLNVELLIRLLQISHTYTLILY